MSKSHEEALGMIFDDLGWSMMIFRNHDFLMISPDFVTCITWRRVLRTPSLSKRECPKLMIIKSIQDHLGDV